MSLEENVRKRIEGRIGERINEHRESVRKRREARIGERMN